MRITSRTGDGRLARYLAGAALLRTADEGARVAIVLLAVQRAGGAGAGGARVAALPTPPAAAAPAAGLLVARARRPMRVVAAAALLAAAGLAVTAATAGRIPLAASMAVLLAAGACGPVMTGALTSRLA